MKLLIFNLLIIALLSACKLQLNVSKPETDGSADAMSTYDDADADGVMNGLDNCQLTPNPDQTDTDANGVGDACDPLYFPETSCPTIKTDVYLQDELRKTIYLYSINNETISIRAFPNWYTFFKLRNQSLLKITVSEKCITELKAKAKLGLSKELDPFPNQAHISVNFYGGAELTTYVNGRNVYSEQTSPLKTASIVTLTPGKNVVAFKLSDSSITPGILARINIDECGERNINDECTGSQKSFYSDKPFELDYTLPFDFGDCGNLSGIVFPGKSHWGLSLITPSSDWFSSSLMTGFNNVPEGYSQSLFFTYPLDSSPEALVLSTGVNHPSCGVFINGEATIDRPIYVKTIITCDYYSCWQADEDAVTGKLYNPNFTTLK